MSHPECGKGATVVSVPGPAEAIPSAAPPAPAPPAAAASATNARVRSFNVQQLLQRKWREEISAKPPAKRETWLKSQEGIVALGAKECSRLLTEIKRQRGKVTKRACSWTWIKSFETSRQTYPAFVKADGRKHGVRMQLSKCDVGIGRGRRYRRWTPPQAVGVEDFLDALEWWEAEGYYHPASPSAEAINRIGLFKGIEKPQRRKPPGKGPRRREVR